ncbi:Bro-N domain-containing protein [Pseudomonas sp. 148P]|uniref:Bro-N domain-containing protein n=1 Tax=Pseudomonas ulcerans TaxID=3115852 RepID=A0ABU7HSE9_9PSED|nr:MULTISPECIES: Bro-N domain-containing protein [unclassified Pseudomonas]MEE1925921.1 Bro-N domain-containing protein [Pseudomonas sp. 147P]MEE1934467.1 Bro-N domain-containing protein [Pseudomonas sp. 148P]
MTNFHEPTLFTRHNRPLHTLWLESQAWFCARELGRLMGKFIDKRCVDRLDPDQWRSVRLLHYGRCVETLMISESGTYTLLAHHYVPENRALRHWLTHEVVAVLRDGRDSVSNDGPRLERMVWGSGQQVLSALYWQNEPWVRLRDMPMVLGEEGTERADTGWRGK